MSNSSVALAESFHCSLLKLCKSCSLRFHFDSLLIYIFSAWNSDFLIAYNLIIRQRNAAGSVSGRYQYVEFRLCQILCPTNTGLTLKSCTEVACTSELYSFFTFAFPGRPGSRPGLEAGRPAGRPLLRNGRPPGRPRGLFLAYVLCMYIYWYIYHSLVNFNPFLRILEMFWWWFRQWCPSMD